MFSREEKKSLNTAFFNQFVELRRLLEAEWGDEVNYEQSHYLESGLEVSRISITLENTYFYDKEQWTAILNWFEMNLLGLDAFWDTAGDIVKGLAR